MHVRMLYVSSPWEPKASIDNSNTPAGTIHRRVVTPPFPVPPATTESVQLSIVTVWGVTIWAVVVEIMVGIVVGVVDGWTEVKSYGILGRAEGWWLGSMDGCVDGILLGCIDGWPDRTEGVLCYVTICYDTIWGEMIQDVRYMLDGR